MFSLTSLVKEELLNNLNDTSTGSAIFESTPQVGIALLFLMENLIVAREDEDGGGGLNVTDQIVVVTSATRLTRRASRSTFGRGEGRKGCAHDARSREGGQ